MQWSTTNELILTASTDGTARVWQITKGSCMRVLKDACGAQVLCCAFSPLNENMIFVSFFFFKYKILVLGTLDAKSLMNCQFLQLLFELLLKLK